jgi:hypothetical protein
VRGRGSTRTNLAADGLVAVAGACFTITCSTSQINYRLEATVAFIGGKLLYEPHSYLKFGARTYLAADGLVAVAGASPVDIFVSHSLSLSLSLAHTHAHAH